MNAAAGCGYDASDVAYWVTSFKMAALASLMLKSRASLLAPSHSCLLESSRFASKKSGGSSKNLGGKSPGRRFGFKKQDGDFVHAGNILATQREMRYHPGGHVGMGTNNTLYALEDGFVRFTKEVYIPAPRSPEATSVITKLPRGAVLYKTFISVLPVKQEGRFKLVDLV
ncbi:39S ribosomal protein L27, mitochondrial [Fundulus heteroclitus]|nr:39S ribosomal protein L27, mitochondrial [Fundulus heteroclitus]